ncbi:hypothetical protein GE21DRAFT_1218995 [Neurospora crassa]|nr:hypothetical protein GE21DRAFT_1218995 [Neurospora crassa]
MALFLDPASVTYNLHGPPPNSSIRDSWRLVHQREDHDDKLDITRTRTHEEVRRAEYQTSRKKLVGDANVRYG